MIKLYGIDFSTRSNKVKMCLTAMNLPYEYIEVNLLKGENKQSTHLMLHPGGKVPVLDDNGFILFESVAIMKYLCRQYKFAWYPEDIKTQALVDQWCDYASQHLDVQVVRVAFNVILAPSLDQHVSEKSIELGKEMILQLLPIFDVHLSKSPYLVDDAITIADVNLLSIIDPLEKIGINLSIFPNIATWREKLQACDFYQKTKTAFNIPGEKK